MNLRKTGLAILLFSLAGSAFASSPLEGMKFYANKTQILTDLKVQCNAGDIKNDDTWLNKVLDISGNREQLQSAATELNRNNKDRYSAALKKVQCPAG